MKLRYIHVVSAPEEEKLRVVIRRTLVTTTL